MSDELNDKNETPDASASGQEGRTEAIGPADDRIAPSSPRGEEGAPDVDEQAAAPEPAPRRGRKAALAIGAVAAALALCAVVAGIGFAAGWFGQPAVSEAPATAGVEASSPASGQQQKQGDGAAREDAADEPAETEEEAAAAEDAAAAAEDEADEPSATEDAESAPASAEEAAASAPSASESAPAPAEAPAPAPAPAPEPEPEPAPPAPSTVTVSVSIDSSRAASHGYPSSLGGGTVTLDQGASVYDALCATGVSVGGSSGYVSSIGGLAEFACGPSSGWLYFVNGSSPGYGCGSYILNGGESIAWVYTCDMGNDL